jgi:hypothetical protein
LDFNREYYNQLMPIHSHPDGGMVAKFAKRARATRMRPHV